jgi:hypothetical protein
MNEVLCYTGDENGTRAEIESAGGRVVHVLTPSVLVAELPAGATLTTCSTEPPAALDDMSARVAEAWRAARSKAPSTENIGWDTEGFEAPD